MIFTYTTLSQANTFISTFNRIPNGKGQRAKLIDAQPGVYTVEVA